MQVPASPAHLALGPAFETIGVCDETKRFFVTFYTPQICCYIVSTLLRLLKERILDSRCLLFVMED